jgi:hypothetical protein
MPDWKELTHAYGSAEDIPEIISALTPDPKSSAWDDLWSRVCHQGTTYSASPAVLPFLLSIAANWNAVDRAMPLALAASIVSAQQTNLDGCEETVQALRTLALDTVQNQELSREDRVYLMQSVLAFQGDRLWGRILGHLDDGEFPGSCPTCRKVLYLVIGKHDMFVTSGDWVRDSGTAKTDIKPLETNNLAAVANWLYTVAVQSRDSEVSECIRYLFGVSDVPNVARSSICQMPSLKSRKSRLKSDNSGNRRSPGTREFETVLEN